MNVEADGSVVVDDDHELMCLGTLLVLGFDQAGVGVGVGVRELNLKPEHMCAFLDK